MAVKKATPRKRATTKRGTTRTTTKRAAKPRTASKTAARAAQAPTAEVSVAAEPAIAQTMIAEPVVLQPTYKPPAAREEASFDERPSRFTGDYYLHATGPKAPEGPSRRPGKWLIFVSRSRIDALWDQVRRAVEAGRLGQAAKVSTALPNPLSPDPKKHVICVYTPDEDDAVEVRRVRDALRALGITWKIPYKSDAATRAGQYEVTTGGPTAKYYE